MEEFIEEAMDKVNAQLFQELLRFYPTAEAEDYFKIGSWRNDMMKTDLQLLAAHRFEAGAPDPPAIEDIKMPELPPGALNAVAPAVRPVLPGVGVVRPSLLPGQNTAGVKPPGAVVSATGPTAELRLIALFVAKWKLDPSQTKQLLAKLTPARRRFIIQNFKHVGKESDPATPALKEYIEKCEKDGTWPAADAAAPPPASTALGAVKATTAVRPLIVKPSPIVPKPVGKAVTPPAAATAPGAAKRPAFGAAGTAPAAATAPAGAKRPAAWVSAGAAAADPAKRPKFGALAAGNVVESPKVGGWAANAKANAAKWSPTPNLFAAKPGQWGSAVRPAGAGKAPPGGVIKGLLNKF